MIITILQIIFWISIGLLYIGVGFPLQELMIGISALVIGIVALVEMLRR